MKHLYSLFIVLFLVLGSTSTWGQNITVSNATGPANCDGSAYFPSWSSYSSSIWTFSWYQDTTFIAGNDSLVTGLCAGNYSLVYDSLGNIVYTENFVVTSPCSNFSVNLAVTNSIQGACTGSLTTTVVGGNSPYTYSWSNGQTTQNGTNLCVGVYTLNVVDMMGCTTSASGTVLNDTNTTLLQANLDMVDDTTGNCWGGGNSFPSGGIPPYSISWSNGQTGNYSGQLCAGVYTVIISDQGGDTLTETFVIADLNTSFGNTIYNDSIPVANLYGNLLTNCTIDYTNIDSASLSVAVYDSLSQNLYVTWSVYDSSGNVTYLYDTIGLVGMPGVYSVNISVYCPTKSAAEYFKVLCDFYFDGSTTALSVSTHVLENISVYPNPFTSSVTINNQQGELKAYTLVDLNGRILKSQSNLLTGTIQVNGLDFLSEGTYLLNIIGNAGAQRTIKLIK